MSEGTMGGAKAIRLQGSQSALVALAELQRQRALADADAAFHAATSVVLREHGVTSGTFAPEPGTGGVLLLLAPGATAPAYADSVVSAPSVKGAPRKFTDTSAMLSDEEQRYQLLRAQQATLADATAARDADDDAADRPTGAELLASTGVDFGAFGNY